jgi:tRNA(fMet)-specific endonuclease VapC
VIKASLRRKGKPIPENDIWIAAIALQHDLIGATRNIHFNEVDGLSTERW